MWLIVGLGNPGSKYTGTRHNVGFQVIETIAAEYGLQFRERLDYKTAGGSMEGDEVVLLEPLTFMNRSGQAVRKLLEKKPLASGRVIVIHDDLDLPAGRLKIRRRGSSGGHRGIESIIQETGSDDFIRVKIGIGRDPFIPAEVFVLSRFRPDERQAIADAVKGAVEAVRVVITEGVDRAMNRFN